MKTLQKLSALALTLSTTIEAWAQAASPVLPPASSIASQPLPGSPGGTVTWFLAGAVVGLVVGYMIGKNSNKAAAAPSSA